MNDYFVGYNNHKLLNYNFVLTKYLDKILLIKKFGPPSHNFNCFDYEVWQYDYPERMQKSISRELSKYGF